MAKVEVSKESLRGQSAQDEPADRRRARLHGRPGLHAAAARLAGLHIFWARAVRSALSEAIPLQTTAMSEVATVLGGLENVEEAIVNIAKRAKPEVIGICSTGVTETKGDDVDGYIQLIRQRHPELDHMGIVYVSTPDFKDAFQDGWEKTVAKLIETFVPKNTAPVQRAPQRINVLPGCHLTPGDIDELRDIIECFGLEPTFLPDLSGSLDGHLPEDFTPTTLGGTTREAMAAMGVGCMDDRGRRADALGCDHARKTNGRAVRSVRSSDGSRAQ